MHGLGLPSPNEPGTQKGPMVKPPSFQLKVYKVSESSESTLEVLIQRTTVLGCIWRPIEGMEVPLMFLGSVTVGLPEP